MHCWEESRGSTLEVLLSAVKTLKTKGALSTDDLSEDFRTKCPRCGTLLDCLSENFSDFLSRSAAERRLCEVRSVISEQFGGLSKMLCGLSRNSKIRQLSAENGCAYKLGVVKARHKGRGDLLQKRYIRPNNGGNQGRAPSNERRISPSSVLKEIEKSAKGHLNVPTSPSLKVQPL